MTTPIADSSSGTENMEGNNAGPNRESDVLYSPQRFSDTSVFYAYVQSSEDDTYWRATIIFGNRAVADEWWRAVSSGTYPVLTENIHRITPQLYTHAPSKFNILNFFSDMTIQSIANPLRGRMFFQLENDKLGRGISIIPPQVITDHVSGNWFYIRSKSNPILHWFYDATSERVRASTSLDQRSMFRVSIKGNLPAGTIMIGTDQIVILIAPNMFVYIDQNGDVVSAKRASTLKFGDLAQGCFSVAPSSCLAYADAVDVSVHGDSWELA